MPTPPSSRQHDLPIEGLGNINRLRPELVMVEAVLCHASCRNGDLRPDLIGHRHPRGSYRNGNNNQNGIPLESAHSSSYIGFLVAANKSREWLRESGLG